MTEPTVFTLDEHYIRTCESGTVDDVIKILNEYSHIDVNINDSRAFKFAIYNNNINVVKYLYSTGKFNNNLKNNYNNYFEVVCCSDYDKLFSYLNSIMCPSFDQSYYEYLFSECVCSSDSVKITKLFIENDLINVTTNDFQIACKNNSSEIINYLLSLSLNINYKTVFINLCNQYNDYLMYWTIFKKRTRQIILKYALLLSKHNNDFVINLNNDQTIDWKIKTISDKLLDNNIKKVKVNEKKTCIICYSECDKVIKVCSCKKNDHYYCFECSMNIQNFNECVICKTFDEIILYQN